MPSTTSSCVRKEITTLSTNPVAPTEAVSKTTGKKTTVVTKKTKPLPIVKPPFLLYQSPSPTFQEGLETVAHWLKKAKRICVLTGAGISVSCGIPDFRSASGLYSTLDYEEFGISCPEELFDFEVFQHNPSAFYRFAAKNGLFWMGTDNNSGIVPSDSHKFLHRLEASKKLLRVYTQNMDGLEEKAGVSSKKVVYAHGSLQWSSCLKCRQRVATKDILSDSVMKGQVAYCQKPVVRASKKSARIPGRASLARPCSSTSSTASTSSSADLPSTPRKSGRKRPHSDGDGAPNSESSSPSGINELVCGGVMKPGITFFGQALNDDVGRCLELDQDKVDAVIVIGTSLSVAPISKVVAYLPTNVPRILINRTIVEPVVKHTSNKSDMDGEDYEGDEAFRKSYGFDAYLLGYCDDVTRALAKLVFSDDSKSTRQEGGILMSDLMNNGDGSDDEDSFVRAKDWIHVTAPRERVFLFPGAQPPNPGNPYVVVTGVKDESLLEVAQCDQCQKTISCDSKIQKCVQCFDYDLCEDCFPATSKTHFQGSHTFRAE